MDRVACLRQVPIFGMLEPGHLALLAEMTHRQHYRKGLLLRQVRGRPVKLDCGGVAPGPSRSRVASPTPLLAVAASIAWADEIIRAMPTEGFSRPIVRKVCASALSGKSIASSALVLQPTSYTKWQLPLRLRFSAIAELWSEFLDQEQQRREAHSIEGRTSDLG